MLDYDYCYIGRICQVLDDSKRHYHHCRTWFRLFLDDEEYSIESIKNNHNENKVVVYKGKNTAKAPIVFQGSLQDFEEWLQKTPMKTQFNLRMWRKNTCQK